MVDLPHCLPGVEMMEENEEQSDIQQTEFSLRKGNYEGDSFRLDSAAVLHLLQPKVCASSILLNT